MPVRQISPILVAANLKQTADFYVKVLNFEIETMFDGEYCILRHGNQTLHITPAVDNSVLERTAGMVSIYIEVEELEAMWMVAKTFEGDYKMKAPFDQEYGMREFHIIDPNGCLIFVGQEIK